MFSVNEETTKIVQFLGGNNFLKNTNLSSWDMPEWMQMDGKLHSTSNLFSSAALLTLLTNITT